MRGKKRKKRQQHPPSIMHAKDGTCYLCVRLHGDYRQWPVLHKHHIFGGVNRKHSETYGLTVYLHPEHHQYGPEAAHDNQAVMDMLHKEGQQAFERDHTRDEFYRVFGRYYIQ